MRRLILVDTSILIEAQRNQDYFKRVEALQNRLVISRITACELIFGARNAAEKKINKELVAFLPIIEINEKISELSFRLIDKYNLKTKTTIPDALIAATVVIHKMSLWTLNTKQFAHIREVELFKV